MADLKPRQYVKLPIPITAQKMVGRFTVQTIEGTLDGKPGDYLVTGVRGEQYPCDASIFEETYEPWDDVPEDAITEASDRVRVIIDETAARDAMANEIATLRAALAEAEDNAARWEHEYESAMCSVRHAEGRAEKAEAERDEARRLIVAFTSEIQWGWDGHKERDALLDYGRELAKRGQP